MREEKNFLAVVFFCYIEKCFAYVDTTGRGVLRINSWRGETQRVDKYQVFFNIKIDVERGEYSLTILLSNLILK